MSLRPLLLVLAACTAPVSDETDTDVADSEVADSDVVDSDTDVVDSDTDVVDTDTDVVDTDTDLADTDTDTDPGDSDTDLVDPGDSDTDVVDPGDTDTDLADTDPGDTDPPHTDVPTTCVEPTPSDPWPPDPRAVTDADPAVAALAADLTSFAADLHRAVAADADADANTWVSPTSLATLLVALDLDADATARAPLDDVLAPSGDLADRQATLAAWLADLPSPPAERAAIVQHALALFHRADSAPGPRWTSAAAPFDVATDVLDLTDPDAARARINRWVRDHTACLIPELFGPTALGAGTRTVLVDAVAVVADWAEPFDAGSTDDRPFHRADGSTVDVPTLWGPVLQASLGAVDDVHVLRLPLADPTLAVYVAWPTDAAALPALEASLDGPTLAALLAAPVPTAVDLRLPKLSLRHRPDVPTTLAAAGLGDAIAPSADRGDLCPGCPLGALVHEATLVLDEAGVRAAAASGGALDDSAGPELVEVAVDRPFLVVLRDEAAGVPLFLGRVVDPSAP